MQKQTLTADRHIECHDYSPTAMWTFDVKCMFANNFPDHHTASQLPAGP